MASKRYFLISFFLLRWHFHTFLSILGQESFLMPFLYSVCSHHTNILSENVKLSYCKKKQKDWDTTIQLNQSNWLVWLKWLTCSCLASWLVLTSSPVYEVDFSWAGNGFTAVIPKKKRFYFTVNTELAWTDNIFLILGLSVYVAMLCFSGRPWTDVILIWEEANISRAVCVKMATAHV